MATPATQKRGWRGITVNGTRFRWRVELGENASRIIIYGEHSDSRQLQVMLIDVRDPWLNETDAPNASLPITPRLVRQAIVEGLRQGYVSSPGPTLTITTTVSALREMIGASLDQQT